MKFSWEIDFGGSVMKFSLTLAAAALAALMSMSAHAASGSTIAAALAAPERSEKDREADANRKPASVLAYTGVKDGDVVIDFGPGAGYYTRLFSRIVGPKGKVFAVQADWVAAKFPKPIEGFMASLKTYPVANVEGSIQAPESLRVSQPADIAFFSLEYHDQHWQTRDVARMNKAIYDALKPGGVYIVIDHSAQAGSGTRDCGTLHRIDPAVVRAEVSAAGFAYAGESLVLRNPSDPLTEIVFGSIRGKTDQFIYKFVKTGR
jgi:predicted methyltransferase